VAVHLVKLACERPDKPGRSLAQWDCRELARQLERYDLVEHISSQLDFGPLCAGEKRLFMVQEYSTICDTANHHHERRRV
jgi:hypothetical protein